MKIKLSKDQEKLLGVGHMIREGFNTYHYIPFWFKKLEGEDEYEILNWNNLPQELIDVVSRQMEGHYSISN